MDRSQLAQQIETKLKHVGQHIGEQASSSRQDMATMEQLIYEQMDRLKAELLQTWAEHAVDDSARPTCPHCDGPMRQKEQVPKTSVCIGGNVTVKRTRWRCPVCSRSFFPSG